MESCQICGKEAVGEGYVEGAKVPLCPDCAHYGGRFQPFEQYRPVVQKPKPPQKKEEKFVDNYGGILKSAREKKGLEREALGKKLFISETDLKAFEDGRRHPTPEQLEKLQRELGVLLIESEIAEEIEKKQAAPAARGQDFTLGDIIKIKKK